MPSSHKSYSKLLERESTNEEDSEVMEPEQLKWHIQNRRSWRMPVTAVLLLSNFLTFAVTGGVLVFLATQGRYCPSELPKPPSTWMSGIDTTLHPYKFEPMEWHGNKYTYPGNSSAGDSVTDEWIELGTYYKAVLIPEEYADDFGIGPSHIKYTPESNGAPYPGYPAENQAMHSLHCLDMIRQSLWYNFDYYQSIHSMTLESSQNDILIGHTGHCINMIRQIIMCRADWHLTPYVPYPGPTGETVFSPDMRIDTKCRNWESLRSWMDEHQFHGMHNVSVDDRHPWNDHPYRGHE
ncbi:hypothetical protein AC579_9673 [Pseudocercospora musae]|uniref:Tat pathway signal sequence n=1 Tax=Pseudocercospora musae TaxID=113226 RepID=A0A139I609_9PEZI|nr:hypothetical protein AC579_9673 [Pseudocercospora musae]